MFTIHNFKSEINRHGFLRTHSAVCNFSTPRGLIRSQQTNKDILLRCETTSLPGINFATDDIRRYGYGPLERKPHTPLFDGITLSFVVDSKGDLYQYFYDWFSLITNFNSSRSMNSPNGLGDMPYEVGYKSEYVTDLYTLVYNETRQQVIKVCYVDAVPLSMSETRMGWGETDSIVRLQVSFAYKEWHMQSSETSLLDDIKTLVSNSKTVRDSSRVAKYVIDELINRI